MLALQKCGFFGVGYADCRQQTMEMLSQAPDEIGVIRWEKAVLTQSAFGRIYFRSYDEAGEFAGKPKSANPASDCPASPS
jgi:hypothetical protein